MLYRKNQKRYFLEIQGSFCASNFRFTEKRRGSVKMRKKKINANQQSRTLDSAEL